MDNPSGAEIGSHTHSETFRYNGLHLLTPNPGALVVLPGEREPHIRLQFHLLGHNGLEKVEGSAGVAGLAGLGAEEKSTTRCRALADKEQGTLVLLVGLLGHLDRYV